MLITSVTHYKGATAEAYISKVKQRGIQFNATYNCLTGALIIDKWYLFEDDELNQIRDKLQKHFDSMVAENIA